jgi:hypothetical protein
VLVSQSTLPSTMPPMCRGKHMAQRASLNVVSSMANAFVNICFVCMRVEITRPWLSKDVFYDHDLCVLEGEQ